MLADGQRRTSTGDFAPDLHVPSTFLTSVVRFIEKQLPIWRDDPARRRVSGERILTNQLALHLNGAARGSRLDHLQFMTEPPDETMKSRSIDIGAFPLGRTVWVGGRNYDKYSMLLPIECKRLPTPPTSGRDIREYVRTAKKAGGGMQRFKAGLHGAVHNRAVLVGYVQRRGVPYWHAKLNRWINALARAKVDDWCQADAMTLVKWDAVAKVARLQSRHARERSRSIGLTHLLIDMTAPPIISSSRLSAFRGA